MKFLQPWVGDFLPDLEARTDVRELLARAGLPVESSEPSAEGIVLDVEVTPNRPDAMSHRGLAREIAAMAGLTFSAELSPDEQGAGGPGVTELAAVAIEVPRLCRRFGARVVHGISNASCSDRVRRRLAAIGAKPISAAVDATNYVLWDLGQPLHAFDLDKLAGRRLIVRKARRGERLVTLDGLERVLDPSDVVVADAERAVSLAGIMGGRDTAVTAQTKNVLLEAAWWDPVAIRRTSRRLGMHTDASHRFERGADPEAIPEALDRAAAVLRESAGGTLAPGRIDARGIAWSKRRATLRLARLRLISGDDRLDLDFAAEALARLGFTVAARGKRMAVEVPSWRPDVAIEEDLVEEVLRVYGYDRLPSRLPPTRGGGGHLEPLREIEERLADAAAAAGLFETMSSPFVDRAADEAPFSAWLSAAGSGSEPISIANPLDQTRRQLRSTLLPALLDAVARNLHRGERAVGLFEVGRVFDRAGDPEDPPSFESRRFGFALAGDWGHWSTPADRREVDFYDAKGLAERLLASWFPAERLRWRPFASEGFTPGACALVETSEGTILAVVGMVSSSEREKRKLDQSVFAGELKVEAIPSAAAGARFAAYSSYPPIQADLSFAQPRETSWEEVERFVRSAGLADLESVRVWDRYEGEGVPPGRVKTTIRLAFRSPERTLSQEEVNREVARLRSRLESGLGVSFG